MFACPTPTAALAPRADRPRYDVAVHVRRALDVVDGTVRVRFTPNRATPRVVLRLWPNGPRQRRLGMRLDVTAVSIGGKTARIARPDPTTLVLHRHVRAHETVLVSASWRLHVPQTSFDRIARWRTGVRLGSFFPILPWDPRRGWITDPPARILGETSTTPTADFDIRVTAPRGYSAFASGTKVAPGQWRATAARDIGVAVGKFTVATEIAHAPGPVSVRVAVAGHAQVARDIASAARNAIASLSRRYGAYRWRTYTLVASPDLEDVGIEYPTFVFIGRGEFIRAIIDHETAHQWFYSLVGNDQARDPWLDEALATWAQVQLGGGFPRQLPVGPPPRRVGAPVASFRGENEYFRQIYGGGLEALASLGSRTRVNCALKLYVARNAYRIVQPGDLLDVLDGVIPGAAAKLRRFGIHR
jgi:hypothetical protein